MGFARLAETSIRKIKGKSEGESLGAVDRILASTIGGALATWNQPIEVIRVEVPDWPRIIICLLILMPDSDAIYGQKHECQPTREIDHLEHIVLHLQGEWYQGTLSWSYTPHRPWYLANDLYGLAGRLCQGMVR